MISYCVCVLRPRLFYIQLDDLIRKTTVPYEILVWLNTCAPELEGHIKRLAYQGFPISLVGDTPWNIGMAGYKALFRAAKYDLVAQVHDDVVCVSKRIAEKASEIFSRRPGVKQLVADVVQDPFTTGGRPGNDAYSVLGDEKDQLFDGPIDGWFSVYHRSIVPTLLEAPFERYFYLGSWAKMKLRERSYEGLLCKQFKVFHAAGPAYARLLDTSEVEFRKYSLLGNAKLAELYSAVFPETVVEQMRQQYKKNEEELESFGSGRQ